MRFYKISKLITLFTMMFVIGGANLHAQTANVELIDVDLSTAIEIDLSTAPDIIIKQTSFKGPPINIKQSDPYADFKDIKISSAPPKAEIPKGYATCGAINWNGKWQEPCTSLKATLVRKENRKCPKGSTFDLKTEACWEACPKNYEAKRQKIENSKEKTMKCRRTAKMAYSSAKLSTPKKVNPCPSGGTLFKGKCNVCPSGFKIVASKGRSDKNRCEKSLATWINTKGGNCPVNYKKKKKDGKYQCRRTAKIGYSPATLRSPRKVSPCQRGATLFNGKCNLCPKGFNIVASKGRSNKNRCERALPVWSDAKMARSTQCGADNFWDEAKGGSCWTCPAQYTRDKYFSGSYKKREPTDKKACSSVGVGWQSPFYPDPGIFGLKGAEGVAIDILKNSPIGIDEMIDRMAKYHKSQGETVPDNYAKVMWDNLREHPESSPALNGAMFYRMMAMSANSRASAADKELIKSFEEYARKRSTFMVQDILDMYDTWKFVQDEKRRVGIHGTKYTNITDFGTVPPDFHKVLRKAALEQGTSPVANLAVVAGATISSLPNVLGPAIGGTRHVHKAKILKALADNADDVKDAVKVASKIARAAKGAKTALNITKTFLRGAGPIGLIAAISELMIGEAWRQVNKIVTMRPSLVKVLTKAKQNVSVKKLVEQGQSGKLILFWGMASNAPVAASSAVKKAADAAAQGSEKRQAQLAEEAAKQGNTKKASASVKKASSKVDSPKMSVSWKKLPGKGKEVGAGGGKLFIIGGSGLVYKWDSSKKNWQKFTGHLARIDADSNGNPWGVNSKGKIYRYKKKWIEVKDATATDIGVAGKGTSKAWIIGTKKLKGGYDIKRRTKAGKWQTVKGAAARIDVDSKGNAWVVNENGGIYHYTGKKWQRIKGPIAVDITVSRDDKVFIVGKDKKPYRYKNNKWYELPGGIAAVSGTKNNEILAVNEKGSIYLSNGAGK